MISGKYSQEKTSADGKNPNIRGEDCLKTFGLVALWYNNSAYTDGRYNYNNYRVEVGRLGDKVAYRVHPPEKKFS
jgi:hypothetical protein